MLGVAVTVGVRVGVGGMGVGLGLGDRVVVTAGGWGDWVGVGLG